MKIIVVTLLFTVCGCASVHPKAREGTPISASSPNAIPPNSPTCPYKFPAVTGEHRREVEAAARAKLGVPVSLSGPYTAETFDWMSKLGDESRDSVPQINGNVLAGLKRQLSSGAEIYYYEWFMPPDKSGVTTGGQTGYLAVEKGNITTVIVLMTI